MRRLGRLLVWLSLCLGLRMGMVVTVPVEAHDQVGPNLFYRGDERWVPLPPGVCKSVHLVKPVANAEVPASGTIKGADVDAGLDGYPANQRERRGVPCTTKW